MKKYNYKGGFMLIELIIGASIIVFAILGPLSSAKSSLVAASDARDYLQSVYLADEVIEYIRMVRDNNIYKGDDWLKGLHTTNAAFGLTVGNPNSNISLTGCLSPTGNRCELTYVSSTGFFIHTTANHASFVRTGIIREVRITKSADNKEALIQVTIKRKRLNFPERTYEINSLLTNWKTQ
jgi:hypothetical protein